MTDPNSTLPLQTGGGGNVSPPSLHTWRHIGNLERFRERIAREYLEARTANQLTPTRERKLRLLYREAWLRENEARVALKAETIPVHAVFERFVKGGHWKLRRVV